MASAPSSSSPPVYLAPSSSSGHRSTPLVEPGPPHRRLRLWTRLCWILLTPLLERAPAVVALQIVAFVILGGLGITLIIRLAEQIAQTGRAVPGAAGLATPPWG